MMKCILLAACVSTAFARGGILGTDSAMSCQNEDFGMRSFLQSKVGGTDCEGMCKKLGAYPNCQCPGFNGEPASSDDTRACYAKYCADPSAPCPNDAFVGCVKTNTAAFLMQMKVTNFGTDCEGMCKKLGAYPNCQCPGFNGEPASSDDMRACFAKYCADPSAPCPNDAFVGCVKTNTAAFLQWQAVFGRISHGFDSMLQVARLANTTKGAAPNPKPYTKDGKASTKAQQLAKEADKNAANEKADAKEMKLVADIEEKEATEESHQAHEDKANGNAIEQAAALSISETGATKEHEKRELDDAKNMEDVAAKEDRDAADTMKDATRMRKDAEAIEAVA